MASMTQPTTDYNMPTSTTNSNLPLIPMKSDINIKIARIEQQISSTDNKLAGLVTLRETVCFHDNKAQAEKVIDLLLNTSSLVPKVIKFMLPNVDPALQYEAAWALTNLCSGTSSQATRIVNMGIIPLAVDLMSSPSDDVSSQAAWLLGNLAGDGTTLRNRVLQANALTPLLQILSRPTCRMQTVRNAAWALSNFCRNEPHPSFIHIVRAALPTLARLLHQSDDEDVIFDTCWALAYLTDSPDIAGGGECPQIEAVVNAGVCSRLVEILYHSQMQTPAPALRALGNICTGNSHQTQAVIDGMALPCLLNLLSSTTKSNIKKEVCWTLSNITAGSKKQIQAVIGKSLTES